MAAQEDVLQAMHLFHEHRPAHAFEEMNKNNMGLFAVMRFLGTANANGKQEITSKEISDSLGVSSARMTVVLKKLVQKNWIAKTNSTTDARAVVIVLTAEGRAVCDQLHQRLYHTMERLVEEFGVEELQYLVAKIRKIETILHETRPNQLEDLNV